MKNLAYCKSKTIITDYFPNLKSLNQCKINSFYYQEVPDVIKINYYVVENCELTKNRYSPPSNNSNFCFDRAKSYF